MLAERVVAAPEDIDLCMIIGAGWPFHLGGITPYLDRSGVAEKVNGSRFRPPPPRRGAPAYRVHSQRYPLKMLPVGIGAPVGAPPASQQTQRGSAVPDPARR